MAVITIIPVCILQMKLNNIQYRYILIFEQIKRKQIATLLFSVQIYCDFGGYSTIAMGTARILGIELMDNFNAPYLSSSVSEFWRRWHISLSSWFRDYLYIPLGGNRKGSVRKNLNLMIVFLVSGLWLCGQWTYVIWGGLN